MSQKPAYVDTQNFGPDDLFYSDELTMSRPFPLHRHSFAELHYFSGGRGTENINGISYPAEPGTMSLKMPWHIHELIPEKGAPLQTSKCSFRMCVLEDNGLLQIVNVPLAQVYDCCPVVQIPPAERPFVSMIFSRLTEERRHIYPMKEEQTATLITQLLILFLRHMEHSVGEGSCNAAQDALRLMNLRSREPGSYLRENRSNRPLQRITACSCTERRIWHDLRGTAPGNPDPKCLWTAENHRISCGKYRSVVRLYLPRWLLPGLYSRSGNDPCRVPGQIFFLRSRPGGKKPVWRTALRKNRLLSSPGLSDSGYIDRCCGIFRLQRKLPETCPEGAGHFLFRAAGENPGLSCETAASRNFADSGIHRQRKRLCFTGNFLPGI